MAVKKLTEAQKAAVVTIYKAKTRTIPEIAAFLRVSARTIGRVIEEAVLIKPVQQALEEAAKIAALMYRHKITYQELEALLGNNSKDSLLIQTQRTKKSPTAHNGKQTLLPLNLPSLNLTESA